ncbi:hypothetical protein FHR29_000052 [Sphingobacterium sp. JUb56]|nr:hypothetical protein [Sphingobacterium sp. JUb56]
MKNEVYGLRLISFNPMIPNSDSLVNQKLRPIYILVSLAIYSSRFLFLINLCSLKEM